jgi:hypothetical protein
MGGHNWATEKGKSGLPIAVKSVFSGVLGGGSHFKNPYIAGISGILGLNPKS